MQHVVVLWQVLQSTSIHAHIGNVCGVGTVILGVYEK